MGFAAIATSDLTKHYGKLAALEALDLEVQRGTIFGFLGPNGSGKTTTIRLLLGFARPTRGHAEILGLSAADVAHTHRHLGYVPGEVALWSQLTGDEVLRLLGNITGWVDAEFRSELIERFHIDPSVRVRSMSKGNRQKIALVAALMSRPEVLLLDEPTAGLDPLMEAQFQIVARDAAARGQTVFLSSHILDEVQDLCDRVGILRAGRLVEVADLADLRRISTTIVDAVIDGEPPMLEGIPGVTGVEPIVGVPGGIRITLSGPPDALIRRLAAHRVVRLRTVEPSLEEIFLTYY